jgi:hypothetical protein
MVWVLLGVDEKSPSKAGTAYTVSEGFLILAAKP